MSMLLVVLSASRHSAPKLEDGQEGVSLPLRLLVPITYMPVSIKRPNSIKHPDLRGYARGTLQCSMHSV